MQLESLEKPFMARCHSNKVPMTADKKHMTDPKDRTTWSTILSLKKPIGFDEAAIRTRDTKEREFRDIAMQHYCRCDDESSPDDKCC